MNNGKSLGSLAQMRGSRDFSRPIVRVLVWLSYVRGSRDRGHAPMIIGQTEGTVEKGRRNPKAYGTWYQQQTKARLTMSHKPQP